jgi:hypothetical protein
MHEGTAMATSTRQTHTVEKRGGYSSSSKPAAQLKPPPKGPAPGASKPKPTTNTQT